MASVVAVATGLGNRSELSARFLEDLRLPVDQRQIRSGWASKLV